MAAQEYNRELGEHSVLQFFRAVFLKNNSFAERGMLERELNKRKEIQAMRSPVSKMVRVIKK